MRAIVITHMHDSVVAGHFSRDNVLSKFQTRFYWYRSYVEIRKHCEEFVECALAKDVNNYNKNAIMPIRATKPFSLITTDIMGPFREMKNGLIYSD